MKKLRFIHLCLMLLFSIASNAQDEKDVENALKLFQKDKEKGIARMEKVMLGSTSSKLWDVMVKMYYERFRGAGGEKSFSNRLYAEFINTCRRGTLYSRSTLASEFLRTMSAERDPDTLVSQSAKDLVVTGDGFMNAKDYVAAQSMYQQAITRDPRFFKARVESGDCFRYQRMPDSAVIAYKKAIEIDAGQVVAWKGLVDAMIDKNDFIFVIEPAISGLIVYPDEELYNRFYYIQSRQHKVINRFWFPRKYSINSFSFENEPVEEEPWKTYRDARDEIKPYCNKDGIVVLDNTLTKSKFMEVYAWEKMLKRPECVHIAYLDFARRMQATGYLDCYVFFSMFHNDIYEQYKIFAGGNKKKIANYINKMLIMR